MEVTISAGLVVKAARHLQDYFDACSCTEDVERRIDHDIEVTFDNEAEEIIIYDDITKTEERYDYPKTEASE